VSSLKRSARQILPRPEIPWTDMKKSPASMPRAGAAKAFSNYSWREIFLLVARPRQSCSRCQRPTPTCYCQWLRPVQTHTRFVILMHEDERRRRIATGRMSFLSLARCDLIVCSDFDRHRRVADLMAAGPCYLLYPGAASAPCATLPSEEGRTVFILDAKWAQSRKMLCDNPKLAALPRISFSGSYTSWFTIKKQPHHHCLSTIEAIAYTIVELPDEDAREALKLLPPFFHVINQQLQFEQTEKQSIKCSS